MPRTASFDKNDVLDAVAELFREHGYDGTSMRHVQKTTGLAPTSLYAAFGSKDGLFEEALSRYRDKAYAFFGQIIGDPADGIVAIKRYLENVSQSCCEEHGCLLMNSLVHGISNDRAAAVISDAFGFLESLLTQAVAAGQEHGDLIDSMPALSMSRYIQTISFGLQNQARRKIARDELLAIAHQGLLGISANKA